MTKKKATKIKDQILIVLADYSSSTLSLQREGTRIEIANRILKNIELIERDET